MSGLSKIATERNQRLLLELAVQPGNDICADCKSRNPRWASHNIGIFICMSCASIHRKIGTHITKVKSLTMDSWTKEQVEVMKSMGNVKSNNIYNPNEIRHPPPPNLMDSERDGELEQYIRSKYEFKRFLDKSALVASKLGPSRSASSMKSNESPRSVSTPAVPPSSSVSNTLPSTQPEVPKRRYTSANTSPPIPRAVSQPLSTLQQSQVPPQPKNPDASSGVWANLVSLQSLSPSSSLPLQYQVPAQQPSFSEGMTAMQTGMNAGINSFQQQQMTSNPYFQSTPLPFTPTGAPTYGGSQQPYTSNQLQVQQMVSTPTHMQPPFFQPQPQPQQRHLQIQLPGNQSSFTSPMTPFGSAPVGQGQFSSSPSMPYLSHSPQVPPSMASHTPQLQMSMQQSASFVSHSPHPMMVGTPLPVTPQPQMQMQQGSFMVETPQFAGFQGQGQGQMFTQGGFTSQQWGGAL